MNNADLETLRLVHKEARERVARLDASDSRLDTKSSTLLGFVSTVSIFLAAQDAGGVLTVLAYGALAVTAAFGLLALRVRRWKESPQPEVLTGQIAHRGEAAALALLTAAQVKVFVHNKALHERKAHWWRLGLTALIVAVVLTVAALTWGGHDGAA